MAKKAGGKNTARAVKGEYRPPTPAEIAAHRAELEREVKERDPDWAKLQIPKATPEELEQARKLDEARRLLGREIAVRDGQVKPAWMKRAEQPAEVEKKTRPKPRRRRRGAHRPVGSPPLYDREKIRAAGRDVMGSKPLPTTLVELVDRTEERCRELGIKIPKVEGTSTTMKTACGFWQP
jgi:hypothetical protein